MRRERPIRPTVMFRLVGLWQRLSYEIGAITRPRQIIALFFTRLAQHFVDLRIVQRTRNVIAQNGDFAPQRQHFTGCKHCRANNGVNRKAAATPTVAEISGATTASIFRSRRRFTDPFAGDIRFGPSTSVSSVCITPSLIHAVLRMGQNRTLRQKCL